MLATQDMLRLKDGGQDIRPSVAHWNSRHRSRQAQGEAADTNPLKRKITEEGNRGVSSGEHIKKASRKE
jgi:hypothetical protein